MKSSTVLCNGECKLRACCHRMQIMQYMWVGPVSRQEVHVSRGTWWVFSFHQQTRKNYLYFYKFNFTVTLREHCMKLRWLRVMWFEAMAYKLRSPSHRLHHTCKRIDKICACLDTHGYIGNPAMFEEWNVARGYLPTIPLYRMGVDRAGRIVI